MSKSKWSVWDGLPIRTGKTNLGRKCQYVSCLPCREWIYSLSWATWDRLSSCSWFCPKPSTWHWSCLYVVHGFLEHWWHRYSVFAERGSKHQRHWNFFGCPVRIFYLSDAMRFGNVASVYKRSSWGKSNSWKRVVNTYQEFGPRSKYLPAKTPTRSCHFGLQYPKKLMQGHEINFR